MKRIIVLLLISQAIFAQKLTKEKLVEKISNGTCECISKKEITKENLETTLGLCMIQDFSKYEKDIEKHYGKDVISDETKIEALGKDVGIHMATNCPAFLKIVMENMDDEDIEEEVVEEEELFVTGNFVDLKTEQFITFSVKEDSGKSNNFILLNNFDNAFLITDNVLKTNELVEVYYYELELYDAKIKNFVTFKIVSDILKK
uniref:hypothetical protein n=1 Tax=Flavobacterium sp. TaxID=239 RepID=UPI004049FBB5